MEKETTRHSKELPLVTSRSPTTVNDIPDQLLKLIFRRLDSHVAYVRAAAVCPRWRRIVSTRGIFSWSCNPHDFSTTMGHYHVVDPSSSSPARPRWYSQEQQQQHRRRVVFVPASPSIDARHFTLDFLPSCPGRRQRWEVVDGCGSLLLVVNQRRRGLFPADLIVCEPISQRYVRIQTMEDMKHHRCLGVFLNGYRNVIMSLSDFSLTCVLCEPSSGIADGVSAVTARVYRHQPPSRWSWWKYGWTMPRLASSGSVHLRGAESARYVGRSKGFIFWSIQDIDTVIATREGSGVLSHFRIRLPERVHMSTSTFRFVDDGDDNNDSFVRVVSVVANELRVFLKQERDGNGHGGGIDWVPVRRLDLREATRGLAGFKEGFFSDTAKIVTAGKGYVVLTPAEETWLFSVELGTMQAEREHMRNRLAGEVYPYVLWFRPRVCACVSSCKRGGYGRCYDICKCK